MSRQPTAREWSFGAAGAVAGCVLTLLVGAVVGPEQPVGTAAGDPVPTVPVPAPPTTPPLETATPEWGDDGEAEEETEEVEQEEGEQPDGAPLVANAAPAGEGPLPDSSPVTCPAATQTVSNADELAQALSSAQPGEVIGLEDGTYSGEFVARTSGTEQEPIFLCGSQDAVLDGGDVDGGYTLHLDSAQHWRLVGFSVSGGQKGVMADRTVGTVIQGLSVSGTGDEAIHLRSHSTDNVVRDNVITDTGNRRDKYGEGVYIGSAVSNWCTYTDCKADRSDRNVVVGNTITGVSSEGVDIKEGTTGGAVIGNVFDGSEMTGADSWVDVKGNNYLIADNVGENAPEDGFQTHQILPGWGDHNVFRGNTATVNGPGHAIAAWPEESNRITCDNEFSAAGEGLSNLECS